MKKIISLTLLALLSTACVSIDGNLIVSEKMTLKKKSGFLNLKRKNVDIEANQYEAHVTALGENNFALILDKGGDRISIPLKSKEDLNLPTFDGEFRISHEKIDQPYDLKGILNTTITNSNTQEVIESCTWDTRETRCHIECKDVITKDDKGVEHKEKKCDKICQDYTITHQGRHEVIFYNRTTVRDLNIQFLKESTEISVAHFLGHDVSTERIIEHQGICN